MLGFDLATEACNRYNNEAELYNKQAEAYTAAINTLNDDIAYAVQVIIDAESILNRITETPLDMVVNAAKIRSCIKEFCGIEDIKRETSQNIAVGNFVKLGVATAAVVGTQIASAMLVKKAAVLVGVKAGPLLATKSVAATLIPGVGILVALGMLVWSGVSTYYENENAAAETDKQTAELQKEKGVLWRKCENAVKWAKDINAVREEAERYADECAGLEGEYMNLGKAARESLKSLVNTTVVLADNIRKAVAEV